LVAALIAAAPLCMASDRLPSKPFAYDAKQTALVDMLRDFAGSINLPIIIADGVTGTVNSKFTMSPRAFLDLISRSFGLIWYHDGTALYVYPSSQIQSRLYKLTAAQAASVKGSWSGFGLLDGRYPLRLMPGASMPLLFTSGPPRHLQLVDALFEATGADERESGPEVVRSFVLAHASAVDRAAQGGNTPGVATLLAKFFGAPGDSGTSAGAGSGGPSAGLGGLTGDVTRAQESLVATATSLVGTPEARSRANEDIRGAANTLRNGGVQQPPSAAARASSGSMVIAAPAPKKEKPAALTIVADEATNTVLVRGSAKQMVEVEALIATLDVPRSMIEVEATIIDISSDEMQALGFDWSIRGNGGVRELQISPAIATSTSSGAIPQGGGYNITTLLASGGRELLARVRALEASGNARVVSQPKVLGAANRTAVLSDKRTASVRVAGNQDARLYSVETGTTLRVTPRLIRQGDQTLIDMELLIEDGGFTSQAVDDVPIAQKTSISTIATLNEGQALLVGGIEVEGSSSGRSAVPWLSRLPVIGGLFRVESSQASRRQRLFLITPKQVQQPNVSTARTVAERAGPSAAPAPAVEQP
jgi:type III secretion protein C